MSGSGVLRAAAVRIGRWRRVVEESLIGRWLELLLEIQFVDRSVALAAKGLLALLPALVTVAAVAPEPVRLSMAATLERRMGLSGPSLELVRAGFSSDGQGEVTAGVVGGLLTIFYATTFVSALRRLYIRTWSLSSTRDVFTHVKGLAWLATVITLFGTAAALRERLSGFPGWILLAAITITVTVGVWWATAFLMLRGRVRWRILLPPALVTAAGSAVYGAAAALWMPRSVIVNDAQYGYFGVFMTIVSWLVGLAFVVVCATALGPVLAEDPGRIGRFVRGRDERVTAAPPPAGPTSLAPAQTRRSG